MTGPNCVLMNDWKKPIWTLVCTLVYDPNSYRCAFQHRRYFVRRHYDQSTCFCQFPALSVRGIGESEQIRALSWIPAP